MAKDRIDQYIETMNETLAKMKEKPEIKKFLALQELVASAERLNKAIVASEEATPAIEEPKVRKPRASKHQAKMPDLNGLDHVGLQESATEMDN